MLRITGIFQIYSESIGNGYFSYYNLVRDSWHYSWLPNDTHTISQPEFTYTYHTNSLGFRDKEWQNEKPDTLRRMVVFGDSFTEGDGVPTDKNFPSYLENLLNEKHGNWEVYNAGISGSDPFYYYQFVKTNLRDYKPDLILFLVNVTDFTDYVFRGGLERFHEDSTTHYRK